MVLRGADGFAYDEAVLLDGAPGDAGGLAGLDGGEGLVAPQEGLEVEVGVCAVGAAGEVGRGDGHDADSRWRLGAWGGVVVSKVDWGSGD